MPIASFNVCLCGGASCARARCAHWVIGRWASRSCYTDCNASLTTMTIALSGLQIVMTILAQMYLSTRKNWLHLESHPLPGPEPGICKGFFNVAIREGIFPQFSSEKLIGSLWKFYHRYIFSQGRLLDPNSIQIQTGFALSECSCLKF